MKAAVAVANNGLEANRQNQFLDRRAVQLTKVFLATAIASGLFETWQSHVATRHQVLLEILLAASTATVWVWIVLRREERSRARLEKAEKKYRGMFEDAIIGIFQESPQGRLFSVNRALAKMYGYPSPEALTAEVSNIGQLYVDSARRREFERHLENDGVVRDFECEICRPDGVRVWLMKNARAVRDAQDELLRYEGTVQDITQRKDAEQRHQFLAYYDPLTSLPNRVLLRDRLENALARARRHREKVALLFLDLDRFKIVNDSLGHSVGDLLLKGVADRLKGWARAQDTVSRLGGDEFVVVLNAVRDAPGAAVAAERIMDLMVADFSVNGHSLKVTCSLGIAMYPDHGEDVETLIKHADAAMYSAKDSGRNAFEFFTDGMNAQVTERLTLENGLRSALKNDELFLMYQPQVDITSGAFVGVEALIRWQHPKLGRIRPDKFIPIAENTGLILPIGEWVLKTACSQVRQWEDAGLPPLSVAVNVSAVQFRQEDFIQVIRRVLTETGIRPAQLELEITERLIMSNADLVHSTLSQLQQIGVKLSIDDFGTGYSSLSYLRRFPVNKLKIDRSFVEDIGVGDDGGAITNAIINMAKSLKLKVIAEGVETQAQVLFLESHNCDEIQGYYFSKPLAASECREFLKKQLSHYRASEELITNFSATQ